METHLSPSNMQHATKTHGNKGTAPHILNLNARSGSGWCPEG